MKADIPDKILINRGEDGKLHHSYWTTDQELVPFEDTIYIRKKALLQFLYDRIDQLNDRHLLDAALHCELNGIIEKIESM